MGRDIRDNLYTLAMAFGLARSSAERRIIDPQQEFFAGREGSRRDEQRRILAYPKPRGAIGRSATLPGHTSFWPRRSSVRWPSLWCRWSPWS